MAVSFVLTVAIRIIGVVSIFGIYSCKTDQCINHAASHTKVLTIDVLQYITWTIFLVSLVTYIVFVVKKKN